MEAAAANAESLRSAGVIDPVQDAISSDEHLELDAAHDAGVGLVISLQIRLGRSAPIVKRYTDALTSVQRAGDAARVNLIGPARVPIDRAERFTANRRYLDAAYALVGSPLRGGVAPYSTFEGRYRFRAKGKRRRAVARDEVRPSARSGGQSGHTAVAVPSRGFRWRFWRRD
jgi:hypothetical protein